MNQSFTKILAIWGAVISTILLILKIIESRKRLKVVWEYKRSYFETKEGYQEIMTIQVKLLNRTSYNISIQNIVFVASRFFILFPFQSKTIIFQTEDEMKTTLFKPGESSVYKFDMFYIHSDGSRNIDVLKNNTIRNYHLRARVIYPDNSKSDSKNAMRIKSILKY
jgi:hypothetical protein